MATIKFLRLNVNDEYNFGMSGADITDQIRGSFCFDHWLCNYKWWHSIFWWGVHVLMVNSYKCYCEYHKGLDESPMNHYNFQKMIAHVWMDKEYYSNYLKPTQRGGSISTYSISTSTHNGSRSRISASALNPLTGLLRCRLNVSLPHWPSAPPKEETKTMYYQLHNCISGNVSIRMYNIAKNAMLLYELKVATRCFIRVGILYCRKIH